LGRSQIEKVEGRLADECVPCSSYLGDNVGEMRQTDVGYIFFRAKLLAEARAKVDKLTRQMARQTL
jgi:hypothetical protein